MWELYDALIEGIDPTVRAEFVCRGIWQAYVAGEGLAGMALLLPSRETPCSVTLREDLCGKPLREIAALVKSWNGDDSALGMAAINAWYNRREAMEAAGSRFYGSHEPEGDVFRSLRGAEDKVVSVIGHFLRAEALTESVGTLRIFERDPGPGDLPDTAEEYLLPESDITIITGMTFTNKTLPRLLQLAQGGRIYLTGPSVPAAPQLREFGVDALYGMLITDEPGCRACILRGEPHRQVWSHVVKTALPL